MIHSAESYFGVGVTALMSILIASLAPQVAGLCPNPGGDGEERTPGTPLVLDLNGDGIHTTSIFEPVLFDIDGDGVPEWTAWTNYDTSEAFLWRDLNGNRRVDGGQELFGDAALLPDGRLAEHGFELLASYDAAGLGGDGDGMITPRDRGWTELRLWIDRNGNGSSEPDEVRRLEREGVVALAVEFVETDEIDGNMNWRRYQGVYAQRTAGGGDTARTGPVQLRELVDVIFARPPTEGL